MVRLDLRGHGLSDKLADPAAFQDGKIWAEDIRAVISAFRLNKPVLAGWSCFGSQNSRVAELTPSLLHGILLSAPTLLGGMGAKQQRESHPQMISKLTGIAAASAWGASVVMHK